MASKDAIHNTVADSYKLHRLFINGLLAIPILFFIASPIISQDAAAAISRLVGDENAVGRQIAVFIAVDRYEKLPALANPVRDAKDIREILVGRYFFDNVIELYDDEATKANINRLFSELVQETKPSDAVFIYYAGHGFLDENSGLGFWLPVDGGTDENAQENWLPNSQIRGYVSRMKARKVALFVDSCFSGDILDAARGLPDLVGAEYFRNAYLRISRQVLTSGAIEAVPDKSEFAAQLKMALEGNTKPYLDPLEIYSQIRLGITKTTPLFGSLKDSGHQEGGSFIFFLRDSPAMLSMALARPTTQFAIEREVGSIQISTYDPGSLYVNGQYVTDIGEDRTITLRDVEVGEYVLEMRYRGQNIESQKIEVVKNALKELAFTFEANPTFTLRVKTEISHLPVYINDSIVGTTPFETTLETGEYKVAVRDRWIESEDYNITGKSREEIELVPEFIEVGRVKLSSSLPESAIITIDGDPIQVSELSTNSDGFSLAAGIHTYLIEHPSFRPVEGKIEVKAREVIEVIPVFKYRTGTLKAPALPAYAKDIIVDGEPLTDERGLVAGIHQVSIGNPFGEPFYFDLEVDEDEINEIEIPAGKLILDGIPNDSVVMIGDVDASIAQTESDTFAYKLLPGKYNLRIGADFAEEFTTVVDVNANTVTRENIALTFYGNIIIDIGVITEPFRFWLLNSASGDTVNIRPGFNTLPVGEYDFGAQFVDDYYPGIERHLIVERSSMERINLGKMDYSPEYRLESLKAFMDSLRTEQMRIENTRRTLATSSIVSLVVGSVSAVGSLASYIAGSIAMDDYKSATNSATASAARERVNIYSSLFTVTISLGGSGLALSPLLWFLRPSGREVASSIASAQSEIASTRLELEAMESE